MEDKIYFVEEADTPLIAAAIHHGHDVREEIAGRFALTGDERLREEDPFTGEWTTAAQTRLVGLRSRFEVDLNRPREKAVYITPDDAWGLNVWKETPPPEMIERSLAEYDAFYREAERILRDAERRYNHFVVFDLHSYNHLRDGPGQPAADPALNPEVNIGTGTMARERWAPVVDRFIADLHAFDFAGRNLDVRENVKFKGGQFSRWVHENFPLSGCAIAIEFKKFFMNEWTGEVNRDAFDFIKKALRETVPGVLEELKKFGSE